MLSKVSKAQTSIPGGSHEHNWVRNDFGKEVETFHAYAVILNIKNDLILFFSSSEASAGPDKKSKNETGRCDIRSKTAFTQKNPYPIFFLPFQLPNNVKHA